VDASKQALERGRANYQQAGVDAAGHQFLARDVLETLPKLARRGERFDLVVLDPPSYASTKRGRFNVEHDYAELVCLALGVLATGGALLACTNHQRLDDRDLERALRRGAGEAQKALKSLKFAAPPPDFPVPPGRPAHLKSAWCFL
jgi:23S rRNA (cytosine1962-C5)-methyltransferase